MGGEEGGREGGRGGGGKEDIRKEGGLWRVMMEEEEVDFGGQAV